MRMLVVEDEPSVQRALSRVLRQSGWSVECASRCCEATIHDDVFDCGVFDVDLPDGNGIELAEKMLDEGIVRRAVFFTARSDAETVSRALRFGPVLQKAKGVEPLLAAVVPPDAAAAAAQ